MALPYQFVVCTGLKVLIVILVIAVLILLDPRYVTAYININYEIVLIYLFSAMTLLYSIISVIMYFVMYRSVDDTEELRLTNCALTEVVFSVAGIVGWLLVCGIGGSIAQRTIIDTGEYFGWIGGCAGVIVCLFMGILAIFALNIVNEKILSPNRKYRYGSRI